jgi:hypothetical protein
MSRWLTKEGKAIVESTAKAVGLPEHVAREIHTYIDTHDIPHVLVARSNRGHCVHDNQVEYRHFDSAESPEEIAEAIGAGEVTCRGIQEVLEKGDNVLVIAGPDGFLVGGIPRPEREAPNDSELAPISDAEYEAMSPDERKNLLHIDRRMALISTKVSEDRTTLLVSIDGQSLGTFPLSPGLSVEQIGQEVDRVAQAIAEVFGLPAPLRISRVGSDKTVGES